MRQLMIKPQIHKFSGFEEFAKEFAIGKGDLVFTHEFIYQPFMENLKLECDFLFQEKYGNGEPSDTMMDSILGDLGDKPYNRVIAVGGGTVIDIAKLMIFKRPFRVIDMFEKKIPFNKVSQLIIAPTTCGTGSEVTNISIAEIKEKHTKMGLSTDELYAEHTVLIPELVKGLPYKFFIYSSVDALIHAVESYISPKSNSYTELFSVSAINMILDGYNKLIENGEDYRLEIIEDFLVASNYAGIAFGNTGVGAVHALSYPLGGTYHVPHGLANYQFFTEVLVNYESLKPEGKLVQLKGIIAKGLGTEAGANVFAALEEMLNKLLPKKQLREYGMKEEEIALFTDSVIEKQQRLLVNNYTPFSREVIYNIFLSLY